MAAILVSFGVGLAVEHLARLRLDTVVLAVAIGLTLGRTQQAASRSDRVIGVVLLPTVAAASSTLGYLFSGQYWVIGSALFVLAMSATVWVRRWGPLATRLGTLTVLPLLTVLIVPTSATGSAGPTWAGVTALAVFLLVSALQTVARRSGFLKPTAAPPPARRRNVEGVPVSTKMAIQLAVALAVAIVVGHLLFAAHWQWVALTAFIVCSGNRGRADVLHKSVLRVGGATIGTILATGLFGLFGPGNVAAVAAIFLALGLGVLLRPASYAYWACAVTAAMALLLGYLGENAPELLFVRLGGIVLGGVIGVTASWLLLPIKGGAVTRDRAAAAKRIADAARPAEVG